MLDVAQILFAQSRSFGQHSEIVRETMVESEKQDVVATTTLQKGDGHSMTADEKRLAEMGKNFTRQMNIETSN